MRHLLVAFDGVVLDRFALPSEEPVQAVATAVAHVESCLRAFPRAWNPHTRLLFVARLLSAALREVTGKDGSLERAPRDEDLEDEIVAGFLRLKGLQGAERVFRELRLKGVEDQMRGRMLS